MPPPDSIFSLSPPHSDQLTTAPHTREWMTKSDPRLSWVICTSVPLTRERWDIANHLFFWSHSQLPCCSFFFGLTVSVSQHFLHRHFTLKSLKWHHPLPSRLWIQSFKIVHSHPNMISGIIAKKENRNLKKKDTKGRCIRNNYRLLTFSLNNCVKGTNGNWNWSSHCGLSLQCNPSGAISAWQRHDKDPTWWCTYVFVKK